MDYKVVNKMIIFITLVSTTTHVVDTMYYPFVAFHTNPFFWLPSAAQDPLTYKF